MIKNFANKTVSMFRKHGIWLVPVSGSVGYFAINTVFIDNYRKVVQMYSKGIEKRLNTELTDLVNNVQNDIRISEDKRKHLKFFHVYGSDVHNIGCLCAPFQRAYIGLPFNYQYKNVDEINTNDLNIFNNQVIKWRSPSGKRFLNSLVHSSEGKKFSIAREIYFTNSYRVHYKTGLIGFSLSLPFVLHKLLTQFRKGKQLTRITRLFYPFLSCSSAFIVYNLVDVYLTKHFEKLSDEKAIWINEKEYFNGALDYYERKLEMHKSLRNMMGEYGAKYFTVEGNEVQRLFSKHLSITDRLAYIEQSKYPTSSY